VFGRVHTTIGLDIGSSSVKVVEVEHRGSEPRLVGYGMSDLIPEAIVEGEIMDRQLVVEAIQNLFESRGIRKKQVISGVSGRGVIVKKITMERLAPQAAREAIHWEAEQHVPYDINDVALDFAILDTDVGPNQMQVLLVAAKRDLIAAHADLIREAGLQPLIIDVNSFAVQNAAEVNHDFHASEVVGLVNVGAELTNVNLVQNGIPLYTQDLSMGGETFLEALQKQHQIGRGEALAALRPSADAEAFETAPLVRDFCGDLGAALERSLVYLKSNGDADHIDRILLSGGGARIHTLASSLGERLHLPVEVLDPLRRVGFENNLFGEVDPQEVGPQLTVGLGLALRKARGL